MRFKTKKQKLIHHNNLEFECRNERNSMIKSLANFKKLLDSVIKEENLDKKEIENMQEFIDLKKSYEQAEDKLLDPDFFHLMMGEKFEDIAKN